MCNIGVSFEFISCHEISYNNMILICVPDLLREVDHYYDLWRSLQNCGDASSGRRARSVSRMQQSLIQAQELGDEKMKIVNQLQELIDHKTRQLDTDQKNLDIKEDKEDIMQMQLDDCDAPPAQKQPRTQSPSRSGEQSVSSAALTNSNGGKLLLQFQKCVTCI